MTFVKNFATKYDYFRQNPVLFAENSGNTAKTALSWGSKYILVSILKLFGIPNFHKNLMPLCSWNDFHTRCNFGTHFDISTCLKSNAEFFRSKLPKKVNLYLTSVLNLGLFQKRLELNWSVKMLQKWQSNVEIASNEVVFTSK